MELPSKIRFDGVKKKTEVWPLLKLFGTRNIVKIEVVFRP